MQLHARPDRAPLPPSFHETAAARLAALCDAIRFDHAGRRAARATLDTFLQGWGDEPVERAPRWPSGLTGDGSPYAFQLAFAAGGVELGFIAETQAARPAPAARWDAAAALSRRLERMFGASLAPLRAVEDLFAPTGPDAGFAAWHAAIVTGRGWADFKIYLNPRARGRAEAAAVVDAALRCLGRPELTAARLCPRGELDELRFLALELGDAAGRLELGVAHHHATAEELERAMSLGPGHVPGDAARACEALAGGRPLDRAPALTCLSLAGAADAGDAASLHVPVAAYADDDREARDRVLPLLDADDGRRYVRALDALAARRLEDGVGLQAAVAVGRRGGSPRVTVSLAPELYGAAPPGWGYDIGDVP